MSRAVSTLARAQLVMLRVAPALVVVALLCSMACKPQYSSGKLTVVATIYQLADFVKNVAGDKVEVVTLLPAGASPHTCQPTPRDVKAVAKAALLVVNGAGSDFWAEKGESVT